MFTSCPGNSIPTLVMESNHTLTKKAVVRAEAACGAQLYPGKWRGRSLRCTNPDWINRGRVWLKSTFKSIATLAIAAVVTVTRSVSCMHGAHPLSCFSFLWEQRGVDTEGLHSCTIWWGLGGTELTRAFNPQNSLGKYNMLSSSHFTAGIGE